MKRKGMKLGTMFVIMLIVCMAFVSTVSAKEDETPQKIITNTDTKTTVVTNKVTINLVSNQDDTEATLSLISENNKQEYRVKVDKVGKEYLAEIYDDKGTLLKTESYLKNPLKSQKGEVPIIINGIILDADIDIYPDKYSYNVSEEGTVNIEVDNFVFADGLTSYFLRLPNNVQYINVYDGKQPRIARNLETSDDFMIIPNYGIVYGPATVLYWWDLHMFDYNEEIKVKVKYLSSGTYQPDAFDHVMEILSGFSAYDDDSFSVTVS